MSNKRNRLQFIFWLDIDKQSDLTVIKDIQELKKERSFTQTIRDGVRLIRDLRQGNLTVLFELFPWAKAEFVAGVVAQQETAIQKELQKLQELIEQGANTLGTSSRPHQVQETPDNLPSIFTEEKVANPSEARDNFANGMGDLFADDDDDLFDDDDDLVVIKKDTSTNASQNLINSLMAFTK